jgi:hypothetical protein
MQASGIRDWRGHPEEELGGWLHAVHDKVLMALGQISQARQDQNREMTPELGSSSPLNVPDSLCRLCRNLTIGVVAFASVRRG